MKAKLKKLLFSLPAACICACCLLAHSCEDQKAEGISVAGNSIEAFNAGSLEYKLQHREPPAIEKKFLGDSLVDVALLDSTIGVKLIYGTTENITGVNLYGNFNKCYLPLPVAKKLVKAQQALKEINPALTLLVWDATRPLSVQQLMWDTLKIPFREKISYLAHPDSISLHNYGAAVDITLADEKGRELDMGTPFDHFGEEAQPRLEQKMLSLGKITQNNLDNRNLLRKVMRQGGFWPIATEWWHFNAANKKWAEQNLVLIK